VFWDLQYTVSGSNHQTILEMGKETFDITDKKCVQVKFGFVQIVGVDLKYCLHVTVVFGGKKPRDSKPLVFVAGELSNRFEARS
jgi:hypothetical protein